MCNANERWGMCTSMDPGHFKTGQRLVRQESKSVVVPTEWVIILLKFCRGRQAWELLVWLHRPWRACLSMTLLITVGQIALGGMASIIIQNGYAFLHLH